MTGAAGVAAAAAASVAAATPAAAANGDALVLGSGGNGATNPTGVTVSGSTPAYGVAVTDNGLSTYSGKSAVVGHAKQQAFTTAAHGTAEGGATGVRGTAVTGHGGRFTSDNGSGVFALGRLGLEVSGPLAAILVGANPLASNSPVGSIQRTNDGSLWLQVASGASGWRKLAGPTTAGAFHLLPTPVRVYDSRPGTTPSQGPKTKLPAGNVARTIDLTHNNSTVPAGARGALVTVLLVNAATGNGNMAIWAADNPKPQSNTLVWGGNIGRFTTTATTALDAQARVKVDASLTTHIVLDVVGYFQ